MAKKGREAWAKRAREVARQEKQALKREKRHSRSESDTPDVDDDALMEEFAQLSARYAADQVGEDEFQEERRRIMIALGIESADEEE